MNFKLQSIGVSACCATALIGLLAACGVESASSELALRGGSRVQGFPPPPQMQVCSTVVDGETASCGPEMAELPALACYRATFADVFDEAGFEHHGDLFSQLNVALGTAGASFPAGNACSASSVSCGGDFLDALGNGATYPRLPEGPRAAAFNDWFASVPAFFANARSFDGRLLSPGIQSLCVEWVYEVSKTRPDASILAALTRLQDYGAELMTGVDDVYLSNIVAAGEKAGCGTPGALAGNTYKGAWVPLGAARGFWNEFKTCNESNMAIDSTGCSHPFDAPTGAGNFVNANFLANFSTCGVSTGRASAFFFDPSGGCGMSCYE